MGVPQPVELMTDEQVARAFGAADGSRGGGFDEIAHTRVMAYELVRSRSRLAHYRTLYTAFLEAGKPYMVENLDEAQDGKAVPVKLVFADDPAEVRGLEGRADAVVWTEPQLLEALTRERTVQDFFTDLLDELEPALRGA
jgi:hypothetical protein